MDGLFEYEIYPFGGTLRFLTRFCASKADPRNPAALVDGKSNDLGPPDRGVNYYSTYSNLA